MFYARINKIKVFIELRTKSFAMQGKKSQFRQLPAQAIIQNSKFRIQNLERVCFTQELIR
jgi:hypothetical protein